jgi:hypothetical protein
VISNGFYNHIRYLPALTFLEQFTRNNEPQRFYYYAWGRKMSAGAESKVQNMDTATMVLATMRRRGISGLPRNYELVYEALNASNPVPDKEFEALSRNPSQDELDMLGQEGHFPHHHRPTVVEGAHDKISDELDGMLRLLKQEQSSLESYSKLLGEDLQPDFGKSLKRRIPQQA